MSGSGHVVPKKEILFSILCGIFLATGFALSFFDIPIGIIIGIYIISYFFGAFFTSIEAFHAIRKAQFDIDFLMLVAAIGAAILGEWAEGALLLFLFSIGHALEHYALARAKHSISSLASLTPDTAVVKTSNGLQEVSIDVLQPGDIIIVKPNSLIAADGIVIKGISAVNQSSITGESIPVDKYPIDQALEGKSEIDSKHKVYAGSINGNAVLEIRVLKAASDSTIAKLIKMVTEAQQKKSPTQHFTDRVQKYYVPAVLILVLLLLFAFLVVDENFEQSFYRAMAVLVGASPCALAISTPSAVLSGISRGARGGVLFKGGKPLEELGGLNAIAFDKTGTLTEGKPKLTGVYPLKDFPRNQLLEIIVAVEQLSDHPLAAALVKGAYEELQTEVPPARDVQALTGRGIKAEYKGDIYYIGNPELFLEKNDNISPELAASVEEENARGNTTMLVQREREFIGIVTLMDVSRKEAGPALQRLAGSGISRMIMLTGDDQKVAEAIAKEIGITDAWGNLLPEDKVAAIDKLMKTEGKVAMVGDGVNDAPAMARSSVGIAMGAAGSDVALETADIALMSDDLSRLPFAINLSRKAHRIIRQNVFISLAMVAVLIPLTISGHLSMAPAVIGHEGSTVLVVFNALRLLVFKDD